LLRKDEFPTSTKVKTRFNPGYYVDTVSLHKRSYKTEVYRIKALKDLLRKMQFDEITPQHMVVYRDIRLATPNSRNNNKMLAGPTVKLELMLLSHVYSTAIAEWGRRI